MRRQNSKISGKEQKTGLNSQKSQGEKRNHEFGENFFCCFFSSTHSRWRKKHSHSHNFLKNNFKMKKKILKLFFEKVEISACFFLQSEGVRIPLCCFLAEVKFHDFCFS